MSDVASYACTGQSYLIVNFPDGRSLQLPNDLGQLVGLGLFPQATPADEQTFVNLNYLMRPPLSDEEILLMPNDDAIGLYYSLAPVTGCGGGYGTNPLVSAGLYGLALSYERNLRDRIAQLRPELAVISDGVNRYRVLLPSSYLTSPACPPKQSNVLGIVGAIAPFIPVIGWVVEVGLVAYQVTDAVENMRGQLKAAKAAQAVVDEVTNGINLVHSILPDPSPNPAALAALRQNYATWQQSLTIASQVLPTVRQLSSHMCGAPLYFLVQAGGIDAYFAQWQPYTSYFYSQGVANMLSGGGPASATAELAPALAGIGLGALALLLL